MVEGVDLTVIAVTSVDESSSFLDRNVATAQASRSPRPIQEGLQYCRPRESSYLVCPMSLWALGGGLPTGLSGYWHHARCEEGQPRLE